MKNKAFFLFVFLLIFAGCALVSQNFNEEAVNNIDLGMSKKEITRLIGNPTKTETVVIDDRNYELWRYPVKRVFAKRYNALDTTWLDILFLDGKVSQWKRVKLYAQPEFELKPMTPAGKTRTYKFFAGKE